MPQNLPTVLVVDDEVRSQESLRRTLEEDFLVFTASSATEARTVMEREAIHILRKRPTAPPQQQQDLR